MDWDAGLYEKTGSATGGGELIALAGIKESDRILDLGCGTGRHTMQLASLAPKGRILGIDVSADMIKRAEMNAGNIGNLEFILMSAEKMAFKEEFDLVFSNIALQWIKGQGNVVRRVYRALRTGGRIAFQLPSRDFSPEFFRNIKCAIRTLGLGRHYNGWVSPWYFPTKKAYEGLLKDAGFINVNVNYKFYTLVFKSVNEVLEWLTAGRIGPYLEPLPDKDKEYLKYAIAMNYENQRTERGIEFQMRRIIALAGK